MGSMLQAGDTFPSTRLELTDGRSVVLPDDGGSRYTIALFYRGHW